MRIIDQSSKAATEQLFSKSIYQNTHLGWLDLWHLPNEAGYILIDSIKGKNVLLGIQDVSDNTFWLHSFYYDRPPDNLPLTNLLKKSFSPGIKSVYTISLHNWYSALLENNGFRKCDEIIQYETNSINVCHSAPAHLIISDHVDDWRFFVQECEHVFPSLWRLRDKELSMAYANADYRKFININGTPAAYLLADLSDENCHILRLAVNQNFQHKGVATALIHQMAIDCLDKGITSFSVNTNKKNSAAINFYESLNFIQIGKIFPIYHRFIHATGIE